MAKTPVPILSEKVAAPAVAHGHSQPWEGVNLWRTPYKGDTDTITQVKRNKGTLDQYVENRTRKIQQMQIFALRNKSIPTWIMMPRDKLILGVQVALAGYVLFQVGSMVYQNLKAKDRIKRNKTSVFFYLHSNRNRFSFVFILFSSQIALQRQRQLVFHHVFPFSFLPSSLSVKIV